jgi:hypothetical protein
MRATSHSAITALIAATALAASVLPASATCTRLGFSVNDYGKDGPTSDAKSLLDKYVAKWAADRKIGKYTTGKKDVTCELFLNLIVFDEHTCRAEATVCWNGPPVAGQPSVSAEKAPAGAGATKKAAAPLGSIKPRAAAAPTAAIETGALPAVTTPQPAAVVAPAAAPAAQPAAAVLPSSIPVPRTAAAPAPAAERAAAAKNDAAVADQALAAAERAAAAAERAAQAAERAAAAAAAAAKP